MIKSLLWHPDYQNNTLRGQMGHLEKELIAITEKFHFTQAGNIFVSSNNILDGQYLRIDIAPNYAQLLEKAKNYDVIITEIFEGMYREFHHINKPIIIFSDNNNVKKLSQISYIATPSKKFPTKENHLAHILVNFK